MSGFFSLILFLVVLTIGFVFEWQKGALEWNSQHRMHGARFFFCCSPESLLASPSASSRRQRNAQQKRRTESHSLRLPCLREARQCASPLLLGSLFCAILLGVAQNRQKKRQGNARRMLGSILFAWRGGAQKKRSAPRQSAENRRQKKKRES
jgi:hypothetical protein